MQQSAQDASHVRVIVDNEEAKLIEIDADHAPIRGMGPVTAK
jgi:hypothetical protein